jgi:hypothetical protein
VLQACNTSVAVSSLGGNGGREQRRNDGVSSGIFLALFSCCFFLLSGGLHGGGNVDAGGKPALVVVGMGERMGAVTAPHARQAAGKRLLENGD